MPMSAYQTTNTFLKRAMTMHRAPTEHIRNIKTGSFRHDALTERLPGSASGAARAG